MGIHLFLSPHLDDAILSCGGAIHRLAQAGERVIIVTAMAGDPLDPLPNSPLLQAINAQGGFNAAVRRAESAQAAQEVHAQVYDLALTESAFRTTYCGAGDLIALYPTLESALAGVNEADDARISLFDLRLPFDEVETIYAPLCVDEHVDHQLVRDWALILTGSTDAPKLAFYEEYPQARNQRAVGRAQAFYRHHLPALTLESALIPLSDADLNARLRAMRCFRSLPYNLAEMEQLTRDYLFTLGDGTPAERFWRAVR